MKKFICIIIIFIILFLCGCTPDVGESFDDIGRFTVVEKDSGAKFVTYILVDNKTDVLYLVIKSSTENSYSITVLLNADGTPMLYERE